MGKLTDRVTTLALDWWVTVNINYSRLAAEQLRVWFINRALFTVNSTTVVRKLSEVTKNRINIQIDPKGRMPLWLARVGSFGYLCKNLEGLLRLGTITERVNIGLWRYNSIDNRSIKNALDWVIPYLQQSKQWHWGVQVEPGGLMRFFGDPH